MNLALLNSRPAKRKLFFADNFDRADAADLGAGWTVLGAASHEISGTEVVNNSGAKHDVYATDCATDDNFSQITVGDLTSGANVRVTARVTDNNNFYRVNYVVNTTSFTLTKNVAGSFTTLGTLSVSVGTGDVVRIEVQGTTVRAVLNGVTRHIVTDTSHATGRRVGLGSSVSTTSAFDNWFGGDL